MQTRQRPSARPRAAFALAAALATMLAVPAGVVGAGGPGLARLAPVREHPLQTLPTSLLVTLQPGAGPEAADAAAAAEGLVRVAWNPVLRTAQYVAAPDAGEASVRSAVRGAARVNGPERARLARLGKALDRLPGVAAADVPVKLDIAEDPTPAPSPSPTPVPTPAAAPDDPYWPWQWAPDAVQARTAWALTRGRPEIVVAVLDTGVDLGHPDLAARLVPGTDTFDGDSDPTDEHGHGTHVAGIIAAIAGNGAGVAGIAPAVTLMPVKIAGANGSTWSPPVAEGILWAVARGARVINLSFGGPDASAEVQNAIDYARASGVVVVAAAGNHDGPTDPGVFHPAAYGPSLAVAALEDPGISCGDAGPGSGTYEHAPFSNSGPEVDLAAPGACILSTLPRWMSADSFDYGFYSGTSMATPVVAAVAALALARDPSRTPAEIEAALVSTALDVEAPGVDDLTGAGMVQAGAAVAAVARPAADATDPVARWSGIADGTMVRGTRTITASATDASPIVAMRLYRDGKLLYVRRTASFNVSFASAALPDGIHRWTVYATDATLRTGSSTARVLVANRRTPVTLGSSLAMTSTARSITRTVTLAARSPFVARFTGPSTSNLLVRLLDRSGRVVAEARGKGGAALAISSLAAGRYTLRGGASVARPGQALRLSAAWLR